MDSKNMVFHGNVIGAVESGGQVYGKRDYSAYAAPYTNSSKEYTITRGWAQYYGDEAYKLVSLVYAKDPENFRKLDASGQIQTMINGEHDWVKEKWNPTTYQRYILIGLIDSDAGHTVQDEMFVELMTGFIADCEKTYTTDIKAEMMYCEIRHLGGKSSVDRIFKRCGGDYSLDTIMASLKKDQSDTISNNQVGDKKFWSRHEKCREFIDKYAVLSNTLSNSSKTSGSAKAMATDTSFIITDFSKYTGMISNSGGDERGKISGGTAGDQTGKEWQVRTW